MIKAFKFISAQIFEVDESKVSYECLSGNERSGRTSFHETKEEAISSASKACLKSTEKYGVFQLVTEIAPPKVIITEQTEV